MKWNLGIPELKSIRAKGRKATGRSVAPMHDS
jgi:hypothetical protein